MSLAVERILERRGRRDGRRPEAVSLAAAAALHLAVVAVVLLLPRLAPPPPPLSFVPVQIIPAQALGVRKPASRPKAEKPPEPPKPEPVEEKTPEPEPEPEPEPQKPEPAPERPTVKPRSDQPVLPDKPEKTPEKPRPTPPKPPTSGGTSNNPAGAAAQGSPDGEAGRKGAPTGNPQGTTSFGSQIAGLDTDFKFGFYINQLLGAIDAKWVRPPLGNDVRAIISFRIGRDGSLSDLQVAESSGYNSFDLAALRAVQNASPFPPLPRGFNHDSLGVNLIVR